MAGWMAHDADRNVLAQHHFQHALALAGIGEDSRLRAHILAGMSIWPSMLATQMKLWSWLVSAPPSCGRGRPTLSLPRA